MAEESAYPLPKGPFLELLAKLSGGGRVPLLHIGYYPYAVFKVTLRPQPGGLVFRMSRHLEGLPQSVHLLFFTDLVMRFYKHRVPPAVKEGIRRIFAAERLRRSAAGPPPTRPPKLHVPAPWGLAYNLDELFDEVNAEYFEGRMARPILQWSRNASYRQVGKCYYRELRITLSRLLDSPKVPRYVIKGILHHELLHLVHPPPEGTLRKQHHNRAFRTAEKGYRDFEKMNRWFREHWKVRGAV